MFHSRMQEKKEEIRLSHMTKAPTPTEKSKKQRYNIKTATKNFDYTTIADRLRMVSWSNSKSKTGQDQVSGGVSVLYWVYSRTCCNVLWKYH